MASYDFNDTAKTPSYETSANKLGKGAEVSLNDTVKAPELKSNAGDPQYMSADAARYFALMQATGMDASAAKDTIKTFESPEGQASMKNIQAETQRYLGLLETAGKTGAKLEDIMDAPGLAALN